MGEIFERVRPELPMEWTGERLTTATAGQVEVEHLHRYFVARDLCRGLDVLDVASGEGYGSALLASAARSVLGVEVSAEAVAYASRAYHATNLRFQEGDARLLPVPNASLDVVVSFETLEHFFEHDRFLAEVQRVLRPGGRLILSSPDRDIYSPPGAPANPYHVHELSRAEFTSLLNKSFAHVRLLSQRPVLGSALVVEDTAGPSRTITFERRGASHYERSDALPRAPYLLAVASDAPVEDVPNSLLIETDAIQPFLALLTGEQNPAIALLQRRAEAVEAEYEVARHERERLLEQANTYEHAAREGMATIEALNSRAEAAEAEYEAAHHEREQLLVQVSTHEDTVKEGAAAIERLDRRAEAAERERDVLLSRVANHEGAHSEITKTLSTLREEVEASRVVVQLGQARTQSAEAEALALRERVNLLQYMIRAQVVSSSNAHAAACKRAAMEAGGVIDGLNHRAASAEAKCEELLIRLSDHERAAIMAGAAIEGLNDRAKAIEAERDRLLAQTASLQAEALEWRQRYEALRLRLFTILKRFGIARASRLVPKPLRGFVRNRMLVGPRQ